jgi:hypothetical protein
MYKTLYTLTHCYTANTITIYENDNTRQSAWIFADLLISALMRFCGTALFVSTSMRPCLIKEGISEKEQQTTTAALNNQRAKK